MKKPVVVVFLLLHFYLIGKGQLFIPESRSDHLVFVNIGLEPEAIATVGYLHLVSRQQDKSHFYIGSSIKFAPLILKTNSWKFNLSQSVSYPLFSKWNSYLHNDFFIAHNQNRAGTLTGLGFQLSGAMITVKKNWNKGFEAGWQYNAFTHITHSQETKDTYNERYPDNAMAGQGPIDGWYGSTGSRLRFGFILHKNLSPAMTLQMNVGTLFSIQKQGIIFSFPYAQIPAYLTTQLSYRW